MAVQETIYVCPHDHREQVLLGPTDSHGDPRFPVHQAGEFVCQFCGNFMLPPGGGFTEGGARNNMYPGAELQTGIVLRGVTAASLYWDGDGTAGGTATMLNADPEGDNEVALTSSDPTILEVPAYVTILKGDGSADFDITPHKPGSVTITAVLEGVTKTVVVAVLEATIVSVSAADNPDIRLSSTSAGLVTLSGNVYAVAGVDVGLASDDTGVCTVPPTVNVAQGASSAPFDITAVYMGSATITASLDVDVTDGVTISGTEAVLASLVAADFDKTTDPTENATITMDDTVLAAAGISVTLTSDDEGVLTIASPAVVAQGQTTQTALVTGVAAGTTTIRANAAGSTEQTDSVTVSAS